MCLVALAWPAAAPAQDGDPPIESADETESAETESDETPPGPPHALAGLPRGQDVELVRRPHWTIGYSQARGGPLFACYPLGPAAQPIQTFKRKRSFRPHAGVTHRSYSRSGYTRGHMVPRWAMSSRYDQAASDSTFTMANVAPQLAKHNAGVWDDLEHRIAGRWDGRQDYTPGWADTCPGGVWVTAGPVYGDEPATLETDPKVQVPTAFYCVVARDPESPRAMAFLVPHEDAARGDLTPFLVSVDAVEAETGLDLFWELDDEVEAKLEAEPATALWELTAPR